MEFLDLPMEPNLLETDIADGSYNFNRQGHRSITDEQKLIYHQQEESQLCFSRPLDNLDACAQRCQCQSCHRRMKYYCSRCRIALPCTFIPHLRLPVKVDIIKDRRELDAKVRLYMIHSFLYFLA